MPRLSFLVPCRAGDRRLPRLVDLLGRQGLAPGEHEIIVVAHGVGRSRGAALAEAIRVAQSPYCWVMDTADIPSVGAGAALLDRMRQDRLDALCFRLRRGTEGRVRPVRFDLPKVLPAAPIMPGAACISRHNVAGPLVSLIVRTDLIRAVSDGVLADDSADAEWPTCLSWLLGAERAAHLTTAPVVKLVGQRRPSVTATAQAATRLREMVAELKTAGNPSENLAHRLLRRSELLAVNLIWDLARCGASLGELRAARRVLREAEVLPVRHLGGAEATLRTRFKALGARWLGLPLLAARLGL